MNKKKILLLVNNIQGLIDALKLELDEENEDAREPDKNSITIQDLIRRMNEDTICEQFDFALFEEISAGISAVFSLSSN